VNAKTVHVTNLVLQTDATVNVAVILAKTAVATEHETFKTIRRICATGS